MKTDSLSLNEKDACRLYVALVALTAELARLGGTPAGLALDEAAVRSLQYALDVLAQVENGPRGDV